MITSVLFSGGATKRKKPTISSTPGSTLGTPEANGPRHKRQKQTSAQSPISVKPSKSGVSDSVELNTSLVRGKKSLKSQNRDQYNGPIDIDYYTGPFSDRAPSQTLSSTAASECETGSERDKTSDPGIKKLYKRSAFHSLEHENLQGEAEGKAKELNELLKRSDAHFRKANDLYETAETGKTLRQGLKSLAETSMTPMELFAKWMNSAKKQK